MHGNVNYQVQIVFQTVNAIGSSKHEAKVEARGQGATTWHQVGKEIGIHSYRTADSYRDVWRAAFAYAKEEMGVRDIEKLSGENIRGFLDVKVEEGVSHATLAQYAAALEKLEVALNRYAVQNATGREYHFSQAINEARIAGRELDRFEGSRAYLEPRELVAAVQGDNFKLAAHIQLEGGARISEANRIGSENLKGLRPDSQTGELKGWIMVQGKGGKVREVGVKPDTYARLEKVVANGQRFELSGDAYRRELRAAAMATGQDYQGSHGLRWSWAQERHQELQRSGKTYEQTIGQVSREMGHERADITEHYLK